MDNLYYSFADYLRRRFPFKVQKISINAGFTCPNRDGTVGWGGCTYCNNQTFNPDYCRTDKSVTRQLQEGKAFFARKYPQMRYLAYFQAYTNTYADTGRLRALYEEALAVPGVEGLVVGTRPDCMPADLLGYLEQLARRVFVLVEYGIESTRDDTLRRINRGHTYAQTRDAVERTERRIAHAEIFEISEAAGVRFHPCFGREDDAPADARPIREVQHAGLDADFLEPGLAGERERSRTGFGKHTGKRPCGRSGQAQRARGIHFCGGCAFERKTVEGERARRLAAQNAQPGTIRKRHIADSIYDRATSGNRRGRYCNGTSQCRRPTQCTPRRNRDWP